MTSPQRKVRMPQLAPARMLAQALIWRRTFEHPFPVDAWDPAARFIRDRLGWDWPQVWLAAFLIYGPLEKLLLPWLGGYLVLGSDVHAWRPDIEALLTGFVEFPFFLAFYIWTSRGIGDLFVSLARNRSFGDEQRYAQFVERAAAAFDRWWWPVVSAVLAIVVVCVMQFVVWAPDALVPPWWAAGGVWPRVLSLTLIGCVAYAVATIIVREVLTIFWLNRLWKGLGADLQVRPYHADRAGGLGAIGQHAVAFAAFVLMVTLFFVMATLLPGLRSIDTSSRLWSPVIVLIWVLYLFVVPSIFGALIWPPHRAMQDARSARVNRIANRIDQQLLSAEDKAAAGEADLGDAVTQIERLKAVHTILREDLPAWPINARIRRQLSLSALLPLGYSLLTLALEWLAAR